MLIKKVLQRFKKIVPVYIPVLQNDLLKERTALITGGTRGIGYAIAKQYILSGANVIITGQSLDSVNNALGSLKKIASVNQTVTGYVLNLDTVEQIDTTLSEICSVHKFDILVNNAGVSDKCRFENMTEEEYDFVLGINLKATYFVIKYVSNYFITSKIEGNILNIASSSSLRPSTLPYTLSKHGIKTLTEGMAKKLIKNNIVVNGIAPGQTATDMIDGDKSNLSNYRSPINRLVTPCEIANMATILVSEIGRSIVGDIVYMTGGSGITTLDDIDY